MGGLLATLICSNVAYAAFTRSFQDSARDNFIGGIDNIRLNSVESIDAVDGDIQLIVNESELQEVAEGVAQDEWTSSFSRQLDYSVSHYSNFFSDKQSEQGETVSMYSPTVSHQLQRGNFLLSSQINSTYGKYDNFHKNDGFETEWSEYFSWTNKKSSLIMRNTFGVDKLRADSSEDKPITQQQNSFDVEWKHRIGAKTLYSTEFNTSSTWYKSEVDKQSDTRNFKYGLGLEYQISPIMTLNPKYSFDQFRIPKQGQEGSIDSHIFSFKTAYFVTPKLHVTLNPSISFTEFYNESLHTVGTKFKLAFAGGLGYRYSPKTTLSMVMGTGSVSSGLKGPDDAEARTVGFIVRHAPSQKVELRLRNSLFSSESGRFVQEPQTPSASFKPKTLIYKGVVQASWEIIKGASLNVQYSYEKTFADIELGERVKQLFTLDTFYRF